MLEHGGIVSQGKCIAQDCLLWYACTVTPQTDKSLSEWTMVTTGGPPNLDINFRANETSFEAAKAFNLNSQLWMMSHQNQQLLTAFNYRFESWKTEVEAGKRDNKTPPQPPIGWGLVEDATGFSYAEPGAGSPVCPPRTDIPEDHSQTQAQINAATGPDSIRIGVHLHGAYWQALTGDTCADGFKTPPMPPGKDFPAGSVFQKVMSPWGGWWLKVG